MYISRNLVALLALWSPTQLCLASNSEDVEYIDNQFIIEYENTAAGQNSKQSILDSPDKGIMLVNEISTRNVQVVSFPTPEAANDWLEKEGEGVKYFDQDSMVYLDPLPTTDPKSQNLAETTPYGINHVKALEVSDDNAANRKVCIVDSGYDINHPDLPSGAGVVTGQSIGNVGSWNTDENEHGTHVAGTIAAIGGNNIGVKGVIRNGQTKLHITKVFPASGSTTTSNILAGFESCVTNGANVINMSLGGGGYYYAFADAISSAYDDGVLIFASSGNSGDGRINYPASYPKVMSVASIAENFQRSSFSTHNNLVDICAPGSSVYSTTPGNNYQYYSGTSMASPHAAGVAALVWSHDVSLENSELENILQTTARDLGAGGRDDFYGHGLIDAKAAYDALNLSVPTTPRPTTPRPVFAPTPPPVLAPVTPPPVATPVTCSSSEALVEVYLKTDNRPRQIRWEVYDADTEITILQGSYSEDQRGEEFTYAVCVERDVCLQFKITDGGGDGICCGATGDGAYSVSYDGTLEYEGGDNFDSEYTSPTFGCDVVAPPTGFPSFTDVTCVDSPIDMVLSDVVLPCDWVEVFASACLCDDVFVDTHCPKTCDSCSEFTCEDSLADFYSGKNLVNCEVLRDLEDSQIQRYCENDIARETCRRTCGYCD